MRTTLIIDDKLLTQARRFTGLEEKSELVQEALKALIERERTRKSSLRDRAECRMKAIQRHRQPG